jgi:hypothetical protein
MQISLHHYERGAAWKCSHCEIWWGSQVGKARQTRFLMQLPSTLAEDLPWDEYRGWKEKPQNAQLCPNCGAESRLVYQVH